MRSRPHAAGQSEEDPFYDFFRRFGPPQPPRDYETRSLGSGFIISQDGYILTNSHVVEAADDITVRLTDKREYKAKVIGSDRRTDVAVLKIDATGLPVVTVGDPASCGSANGWWRSARRSASRTRVTAGIVSAKGRSLPQENFVPFIQTDVAINPGNSGGPLFNMKGEVVGINSMIFSRTGGFMGLSFAIPIDVAIDVAKQLQTTGRVSRGRIGVVIQEVTKELAESFGLPKADRRTGQFGREGRPGGQGRHPAERRHPQVRQQGGHRLPTSCRASSPPPSPGPRSRCRSGAKARRRICRSWSARRRTRRAAKRQPPGKKSSGEALAQARPDA